MLRALAAVALVWWFPMAALAQAQPVLTVTSPTFKAGETIPRDYTADGKNVSPPLQWSGAPATTQEFAVICDDPDVPHHYHFKVYAIDAVLDLKPGLTKAELLDAIKGHIVGKGELVAVYERKPAADGANAAEDGAGAQTGGRR
jgi:phosphatidylethanolamine-binding protein (PEBP) family uncharacterized protein